MQPFFSSPDLIVRCLIGFAVGGLIGLERQKRMTEAEAIGVRSFGLHSLFGMIAAYSFTLTENPILLIYASAISAALVTIQIVYKIFRTMRKGLTTSIVFALSFVLGALVGFDKIPAGDTLVGSNEILAMTISFLVFLVLGFKEELANAVSGISKEEMISAVELGVLLLFLWPLIPVSLPILGIEFPLFQTYILIVLLLAISFANYILVKKYKTRGPYFFGFFGGFANSEATVSSLTDFHVKTDRENIGRISVATIFANIAMVLRNGFIVALLDPSLKIFGYYLIPVGILIALGAARAVRERNYKTEEQEHELHVRLVSPFEFGAALRFAAIFTAVSLASIFLEDTFQDFGVIFAAVFGGMASAGAVVAAVVPAYYVTHTITLATAVYAVTITTVTSVLNKVIYVYFGDREGGLARRVAKDALVMTAGVIVYLLLLVSGLIPV